MEQHEQDQIANDDALAKAMYEEHEKPKEKLAKSKLEKKPQVTSTTKKIKDPLLKKMLKIPTMQNNKKSCWIKQRRMTLHQRKEWQLKRQILSKFQNCQ